MNRLFEGLNMLENSQNFAYTLVVREMYVFTWAWAHKIWLSSTTYFQFIDAPHHTLSPTQMKVVWMWMLFHLDRDRNLLSQAFIVTFESRFLTLLWHDYLSMFKINVKTPGTAASLNWISLLGLWHSGGFFLRFRHFAFFSATLSCSSPTHLLLTLNWSMLTSFGGVIVIVLGD